MASKQESVADYYEMAREIARVEKEAEIERWVKVIIERQIAGDPFHREVLHTYDIPRDMRDRWEWVFRWRRARLQCQYPKDIVTESCAFYRKVKGHNIGMQEDLGKFVSAKAQYSKQLKIVEQYRSERKKENNMFYSEEEDQQLQDALAKLERKRANILAAEDRLKDKVEKYIKTQR